MMKEIIITILIIMAGQNLLAHGGHMGVFTYQIEPTSITLEFKIESSALDHFDLKQECDHYETATALCLFQYLNAKSMLHINEDEISFELESARQEEGFFILKMRANGDFYNCGNITLSNKCFWEYDRTFENRIIIQKEGVIKSYLLNYKNTDIIID